MESAPFPIRHVVLYKHGVGYFEREGRVDGAVTLGLTFRQAEVSDVLKSLTVLDLDGGQVASVSYDSTKPLEQLLAEVALDIPDSGSLVGLLPQIKGARVRLHTGVSDPLEGILLGIDTTERSLGDAVVKVTLVSILTEAGEVRSYDLHQLAGLQILDAVLRRDLDYYLKTQLSAKQKDRRTFTFFAQGQGARTIRLGYVVEAPVWKATYRILLGEEGKGPLIQGWAVVDNTQDEDWENIQLTLVSGLPVSFRHDLYTPRYVRRPEIKVAETSGVMPPEMEAALALDDVALASAPPAAMAAPAMRAVGARSVPLRSAVSSMTPETRERKVADLFEYQIEHPVTIRRNQSALVPIVLRGFEGQTVLLYNAASRKENALRAIAFKNTTGLTLEGGPVTVLEAGSYVGEAMLDTLQPDEHRLVPYAVELSVHVLDNLETFPQQVRRVVIRGGTLFTHSYQSQQTTYHFTNKGDRSYILWLEHPRPCGDWELINTPAPAEVTANYWRFRFELPPRQTTKFVVTQKSTTLNSFALATMNEKQLGAWIEQRHLDEPTARILKDAVRLQLESSRIQAALQQLETERAAIHQEQGRIRENLQSLGDRPAEKELRERFVRTFNHQEDRLEAIRKETDEKTRLREEVRAKLETVLGSLQFDSTVGG